MRIGPTTGAPTRRGATGAAGAAQDAIWERYRDNLPRHLIAISRDLQTRARLVLAERHGHRALRPSFGPFLSLLSAEGRPVGAIARELAISDQACSQLAQLVEEAGYLERRANPDDRRSRLVRLTPRGAALVEQGLQLLLETEAEYASRVGAPAWTRFTAALAALYRGLGVPDHADPALVLRAGRSVGLLPLLAVRIQRELMEATIARGHPGLRMSHGQVLVLIGPGGARIHEIARTQRVSRQAISATTRDLEALGYLRREPDPADRRGVVVRLTRRGAALLRDSVAAVEALEADVRRRLGPARHALVRRIARELYRALHLEAEVFGAERPHAAARASRRDGAEIRRLATRLRRRLGSDDAARLASLLDSGARRTAT